MTITWGIVIGGIISAAVFVVGLIYALSALMPMLLDENEDGKD